MKTVALYARVSTSQQEKEATIRSQLELLLAYAKEQGYLVPTEYQFTDQAISGSKLARPGLDRLRDLATTGILQIVLCLSPDRLARHFGIQQVVLDELDKNGVKVIFLNQPSLGDSPQEKLLLNVQGAFAEYERVAISERMRRGRRYKLKQGLSVPWPVPYAYQYQKATDTQKNAWIVDEARKIIVKEVFEWYTDEKLGQYAIAKRLNQQKVPSPAGKLWNSGIVGRILRQSAYKGTAYFSRKEAVYKDIGKPKRQGRGRLRCPRYTPQPVENWISIPVPAIISEDTWNLAQELLKMNTKLASRNNKKHNYLLKGLLVCGICGSTLQGRTQNTHTYYSCPKGGKHRRDGVPKHTTSLRADVAEKLIWNELAKLLREPEHIQKAWEEHKAEQSTSPNQINLQEKRKKHLQRQRQRLIDAYQAEVITLEELTERKNPLELELQQLQNSLNNAESVHLTEISLEYFTEQIEKALKSEDFQLRQEVLRLLIERILISDNALSVEHIVPIVNDSRLRLTFCKT